MKACIHCRKRLPLEMYYRHKMMADGHLNSCKACVKARVRAYRAANLESIREYDRQRGQLPHRKAGVAERAHRYQEQAKIAREIYKERYPQRRKAHNIVNNAIRDGKLKVKPCERCNFAFGVQAHHEDYDKPLDVMWLCTECHGERHREINAERRRSAA